MPPQPDLREWMAVGEQAGAARAGETMWSGPYLEPGERVTVVPKARAEAAEQRANQEQRLREGHYMRIQEERLRAEAAEQRVRETEEAFGQEFEMRISGGELRRDLEAKLATAVEALKTARRRIRQFNATGFASTRRQIALDATCEIDDCLSEIEQGDAK